MNIIKRRLDKLELATGPRTTTTIRVIPVCPVNGYEVLSRDEESVLEAYEARQMAMAGKGCATVTAWGREQAQKLMAAPQDFR